MEQGPELAYEEPIMTLTYHGQKYIQNNAAATISKLPVLLYRGHKVAQ